MLKLVAVAIGDEVFLKVKDDLIKERLGGPPASRDEVRPKGVMMFPNEGKW